jgi:glyoxylase-like metal-dependent hydrolase (beta-lactamase superfamily II)
MEHHSRLPPGVVVLERGWLSSNNVVIRGRDGAAVVDSGYWSHAEQTVGLIEHAIGGLPVRTLVNTHLHSDHCGGNAALQARWTGLQTLIPPGHAAAVRHWDEAALTYRPTGQHCPRFSFDATLQPGESVTLGDAEWEVHAAPGHDQHSVVLFEPVSRTLISADALWENGFGVVFQELEGEHAFDEVAATLDLIEVLDPSVVIPGHGSVFVDVRGALERARSRLEAYQANPQRHAAHAAKVLLKFKLLEVQSAPLDEFVAWAENTAYFGLVWRRWFAAVPVQGWVQSLLEDLARNGVARIDGGTIANA